MGSVLNRGGLPLWPKRASELYTTLVGNPGLLQYTGTPAEAPEILDYIQVPFFYKKYFYTRTIEYLKSHPDFSAGNNLLLFPYDWREDINHILRKLRERLIQEYGQTYNSKRQATRDRSKSFVLIGHSLGGLVLLLAAHRRLIHPKNIEALILVGTPLVGSATAFRALFDRIEPIVDESIEFWWGKNAETARSVLRSVLSTCPSIYELMPPIQDEFIWDDENKTPDHPFRQGVLPKPLTSAAIDTHAEIRSALKNKSVVEGKLFILHGLGLMTDEFYFVSQGTRRHTPYVLVPPFVKESDGGDGTITNYSATDRGRLSSENIAIPVTGIRHSAMCQSSRVVDILKTIIG